MNGSKIFTLLMVLAFGFALPLIAFAQNQSAVQNQDSTSNQSSAGADRAGKPDINTVKGVAVVTKVDRPENCLRIRTGPGSSYDIIGCARLGDQLELTGVWTSNNWAQLTGDGWVFGDQIDTDLKPPLRVSGNYSFPEGPIAYEEYVNTYPEYGYSTYWYNGIPLYVYNAAIWHRFYPWRWRNVWWKNHHDRDWWDRKHNHQRADRNNWRDRDSHRDGDRQRDRANLRDLNNTSNLTGKVNPNNLNQFRKDHRNNQNNFDNRRANINEPKNVQKFRSRDKVHTQNSQSFKRQSSRESNIVRHNNANSSGHRFRQFNSSPRQFNASSFRSSPSMGRSFSSPSVRMNSNFGSNRSANFSSGMSRGGASFGAGAGGHHRR